MEQAAVTSNQNATKAAPEGEAVATTEEVADGGFSGASSVLGFGPPPSVENHANSLQRINNQVARQKVMQSIQRRYGNNYAAQVADTFYAIRRKLAGDNSTVTNSEGAADSGSNPAVSKSASASPTVQRDYKPSDYNWKRGSYNYNESSDGKQVEKNEEFTGEWSKKSPDISKPVTKDDVTTTTIASTESGEGDKSISSLTTNQTSISGSKTENQSQSSTSGTWNSTDQKDIAYGKDSTEYKLDKRTNESSTSTKSGDGTLDLSSGKIEYKNADGKTTSVIGESNSKQTGTWKDTSNKTTTFGADNKDKKQSEESSSTSFSSGADTFKTNDSNSKATTQYDGTTTTTVTKSQSNSTTSGTFGDSKTSKTVYGGATGDKAFASYLIGNPTARTETSQSDNSYDGTKIETEKSNETKVVNSADTTQNTTTKTTDKTSSFKGDWNEKTTKTNQSEFGSSSSTVTKTGDGTRTSTSNTTTKDYTGADKRQYTDTITKGSNSFDGTENTVSQNSSINYSGYSADYKNSTFTGQKVGVDYKSERGRPKDQNPAPTPPKQQEAVLYTKKIGSFDTTKDGATKIGDAKNDDHSQEYNTTTGTWERGSAAVKVTDRNASISGSAGVGAGATGYYTRTDKTKVGDVGVSNTFTANGTAGATADASGSASIGLDGLNLQGKASIFAGVKGDLDNKTTVSLGRASTELDLAASAQLGLGADAAGSATLNAQQLNLTGNASAFAGLSGRVSATDTTGYGGHNFLTASGYAEGSIGAGANANGTFSIDWSTGTVTIGGGAGATIGLGGSVGGTVTVNFKEMTLAGAAAAEDAYTAVDSNCCGRLLLNTLAPQVQFIIHNRERIEQGVQAVGHKIEEYGQRASARVQQFINDHPRVAAAVQTARNAYNSAVNTVQQIAGRVRSALPGIGEAIKKYGPTALAIVNPVAGLAGAVGWAAREGVRHWPEIKARIGQLAQAGLDGVHQVGQRVGQMAQQGVQRLGQIGHGVVAGAERFGERVEQVGQNVASSVESAGQRAMALGASAAQRAEQFGQRIQQTGANIANMVGQGFNRVQQVGTQVRQFAQSKIQEISNAGNAAVGWAQSKLDSARSHLEGLPELLRAPAEGLLSLAQNVLNRVRNAVQNAVNAARNLVNAASQAAQRAMESARAIWERIKERARVAAERVTAIWNALKQKARTAAERVKSIWNNIKQTATTVANRVRNGWNALKQKATQFGQTVRNAWESVKNKAQQLRQRASQLWAAAKGRVQQAVQLVQLRWEQAKALARTIADKAKNLAHRIGQFAGQQWERVKGFAHTVGGWISQGREMLRSAWQRVQQTATNLWNSVPPGIRQGIQTIGQGIQTIGQGLAQAGRGAVQLIENIGTQARSYINRAVESSRTWCNQANVRVFGNADQLAGAANGAAATPAANQAATAIAPANQAATAVPTTQTPATVGRKLANTAGLIQREEAGGALDGPNLAAANAATQAAQAYFASAREQGQAEANKVDQQASQSDNQARTLPEPIEASVGNQVNTAVTSAQAASQDYASSSPQTADNVNQQSQAAHEQAQSSLEQGQQMHTELQEQANTGSSQIQQNQSEAENVSQNEQSQVTQNQETAQQQVDAQQTEVEGHEAQASSTVESAAAQLQAEHEATTQSAEAGVSEVQAAHAQGQQQTTATETEVQTEQAQGEQEATTHETTLQQEGEAATTETASHENELSQHQQNVEQEAGNRLAEIEAAKS